MELEPNDLWQEGGVALLDFEDGSGGCLQGNPPMNTEVHGTVPETVNISGVRFTLGVPFDRNHRDATTAPAPLNTMSMHWGWNGGYKFLRIDGASTGVPDGFAIHIGSTGCEGDMRGNVTGCVQDNRAEIALDGIDPALNAIVVDVAALLSGSDIDANLSGPPGCMSGFDDDDCALDLRRARAGVRRRPAERRPEVLPCPSDSLTRLSPSRSRPVAAPRPVRRTRGICRRVFLSRGFRTTTR